MAHIITHCVITDQDHPEKCRSYLPHDPGDQHHGSFIEGVKKLNEDLSFLSQLPQSHTKHDGKHYQTKNIHAVLVCSKRHLKRHRNTRETVRTQRQTTRMCVMLRGIVFHLLHCDVAESICAILRNQFVAGCILQ